MIIESRWTLVRDGAGEPRSILSINTDVTDRRQLEQQFYRAQRLESIGTLAGGIAHDLNNVLAPIMLGMGMLQAIASPTTTAATCWRRSRPAPSAAPKWWRRCCRSRAARKASASRSASTSSIADVVRIARDTFPKNIEIVTDGRCPSCRRSSATRRSSTRCC